ncbi:MAG: DUF366 family protein [Planctomycetota bacterium]|jgi:hypothetical protein
MRTLVSDLVETYDGSQLRGGWLESALSLEPDAVAAFTGPCDVAREHMIDLEDLEASRTIVAREMLHFIAEHADGELSRTALRQRLLVTCARESLEEGWHVSGFERDGDDLFIVRRPITTKTPRTPSEPGNGQTTPPLGDLGALVVEDVGKVSPVKRKLSVSIATRSRSRGTGLIHLGINIDPLGAPVPAVGLAELRVDPARFAEDVMRRYAREIQSARRATEKVREAP